MFSSKLILYTYEIYNQILIYGILGVTLRIVTKKGVMLVFYCTVICADCQCFKLRCNLRYLLEYEGIGFLLRCFT